MLDVERIAAAQDGLEATKHLPVTPGFGHAKTPGASVINRLCLRVDGQMPFDPCKRADGDGFTHACFLSCQNFRKVRSSICGDALLAVVFLGKRRINIEQRQQSVFQFEDTRHEACVGTVEVGERLVNLIAAYGEHVADTIDQ